MRGVLETSSIFVSLRNTPWCAAFTYDENVLPGRVSIGVVEWWDHRTSDEAALKLAQEKGFVLLSREGE